ncbi:MAG: response regulator [Planctomycetes bacterium]|nr:response regulator [Planctomycetota bacterium]
MKEVPRMDSISQPDRNTLDAAGDARHTWIVVIDDDPDCRLLVRDAIEESIGTTVKIHECGNGKEGYEYLCSQPGSNPESLPTLVFLDLEMPHMDGMDVLRSVRAIPELSLLPIVVLTGVDDDSAERQVMSLGANSYTCKGKDADTLITRVSQAATYWTKVHRPLNRVSGEACTGNETPSSDTKAA